ncbi:tyrosine-type recombinase/integrase [Agromyces larvae]|uniref:Tyrosine-type recombinase/integrase n=1 Tax=Agromyces larvae TaxID=2929802 RepID=A0ABY4C4D9_9MICO|nr:tyrosine-type recombinase/integrase [Agromyces larvae]UOE45287.1 tyrosine-type recombinase/integrase [Agromyces larvae]
MTDANPEPGDPWADALATYLGSLDRLSDSTRAVLGRRLRRIAADLGGTPWEVDRDRLADWLAHAPGSPATAKAYRGAARGFFTWAHSAGLLETNPMPARPSPSRYRKADRWNDTIALFMTAQRAAGIADGTIANRVKHVRRFAEDTELGPFDPVHEQVVAWLETASASRSRRAALRTSLRAFYRWAHNTGRILVDPTDEPDARRRRRPIPETWAAHLHAFVVFQQAIGKPSTTIALRRYQLAHLARDHASIDPFAMTLDDLAVWMHGRTWANETRRSVRSTLRAFYRWAEDTGRIDDNPASKLPPIQSPPPRPRPATADEYRAALERGDERTSLAIRLAAELGMRCAEVAVVHSADLIGSHAAGYSLVVHGKGSKERIIPVTNGLAAVLRDRGEGYLFPGQDHGHISPAYLSRIVSRLLPVGVTMHALRHRFATLAYNIDRDVFTVQQLLGHASPTTTQRYVLVDDSAKRRLIQALAG